MSILKVCGWKRPREASVGCRLDPSDVVPRDHLDHTVAPPELTRKDVARRGCQRFRKE
ncbi:hypothetical protein [Corynebacterium efficiens YS-314]|uniref:Uncharacterized protein n=1 Tax=Corynebacterium efficiens (strain DSM 44549 / YS-314 / AJ 12310 / JCM 11189 / NBRC 100395) TaxID=196164 RepID=Q8FLS1_COREF|nr:hypothetical protein [Corynebacterium efficiens YS-314]